MKNDMENLSTEQRLQLVRQIRSRYHEDKNDIYNREQILLGKSVIDSSETIDSDRNQDFVRPLSTFWLRFFISLFLLGLLIFMDTYDKKIAGITSTDVFEVISADYEAVITTWIENSAANLK